MEVVVAFSRFEGRLTHLGNDKKSSFGPRRVLYPQLTSLEDTGARFGPDPALFLDSCLADEFVRFAERLAGAKLGVETSGNDPLARINHSSVSR